MRLEYIVQKYKVELILLSLIMLGAILRIHNIENNSLWLDEIGQVIVATKGFPDLITGVSEHLSPPLDYIIMHLFLILTPHNEFFYRLPSAVFGVGSIVLIYFLGKHMFSSRVGLISAVLLATSPFAIHYSQEARMYSSFLFFSLLSFYTFVNAIDYKNNYFYAWVISSVLLIYTHYFGFFVILIQFLFILIKFKIKTINFKELSKFLIGNVVIGLSFLFWLGVFLKQTHDGSRILRYGVNEDWTGFFIDLLITYSGFYSKNIEVVIVLLVVLILLIGIVFSIKKYFERIILLTLWLLLPLVIVYVLTMLRGPMTTQRNLIFALPAFLLILSLGVLNISQKLQLYINIKNIDCNIIIVLAILISLILPNVLNVDMHKTADWRGVANYLTKYGLPGDDIILVGGTPKILNFYYKGNVNYSRPRSINEFTSAVLKNKNSSDKCTWVFISGHSYNWWNDDKNGTNKILSLNILKNNSFKIANLYGKKDKGLYKSCLRS